MTQTLPGQWLCMLTFVSLSLSERSVRWVDLKISGPLYRGNRKILYPFYRGDRKINETNIAWFIRPPAPVVNEPPLTIFYDGPFISCMRYRLPLGTALGCLECPCGGNGSNLLAWHCPFYRHHAYSFHSLLSWPCDAIHEGGHKKCTSWCAPYYFLLNDAAFDSSKCPCGVN